MKNIGALLAIIGGFFLLAKWFEVGQDYGNAAFVGVGFLAFFGVVIYTIFTKKN
jgi:hypothetical protein